MLDIRTKLLCSAAAGAALVLAGCGGKDAAAGGSPSTPAAVVGAAVSRSDADAASSTVRKWAGATSATDACALMSRGFATFAGNGDETRCAARFKKAVGSLQQPIQSIESVQASDGQLKVTAAEEAGPAAYFLVNESGAWRINSLGTRRDPMPAGPPPRK